MIFLLYQKNVWALVTVESVQEGFAQEFRRKTPLNICTSNFQI